MFPKTGGPARAPGFMSCSSRPKTRTIPLENQSVENHNKMKFLGATRPLILRKFLAIGRSWGGALGGVPLGGGRGLLQKGILRFLRFGPPKEKNKV